VPRRCITLSLAAARCRHGWESVVVKLNSECRPAAPNGALALGEASPARELQVDRSHIGPRGPAAIDAPLIAHGSARHLGSPESDLESDTESDSQRMMPLCASD
jgi:hypothetical protein